jgi:hypothetical protein
VAVQRSVVGLVAALAFCVAGCSSAPPSALPGRSSPSASSAPTAGVSSTPTTTAQSTVPTSPVTSSFLTSPVSLTDIVALRAGRLAVASLPWHHGDVDLINTQTGRVLRTLLPNTPGGLSVAGLWFVRTGHLLVTYTTGPTCTSDLYNCGALPHTCGGELDDIDLSTGTITVLWRLGVDTRLASAVPSPDGTQVAAMTSACTPYANDHLIVRRLRDGATWTIGASTNRCQSMSTPAWTHNGRDLLVTCWSTTGSWLVQVDAHHPQLGLIGPWSPPPKHCNFEAVATQGGNIYAIEGCATHPDLMDGPASLVQLTSQLRTARTWPLGNCTDGGDALSVNGQGQVLVSIYLYCSAGTRMPETDLILLNRGNLTKSASTQGGVLAYQFLTW